MRQPAQVKNQERFGQNVKRRRRDLDWTQEDLAHAAGMHPTAVSRIERGVREPGLHTIIDLARALSVKPGELLRGVK